MSRMLSMFVVAALTVLSNSAPSQQLPESLKSNGRPQVIIFYSVDCPICQQYVHTLNTLHKQYAGRVELQAILSEDIGKKQLTEFVLEYQVDFPLLYDKKGEWMSRLNPAVTPEVFLFNPSGLLVYQGAIDNWFYELGKYRPEPTEHYLMDALEATLGNQAFTPRKTEAIGCMIQHKKHPHH
jgi:peroxiredoxin